MSYFHAILLGIVQGITEYLPISSSAHLILVPKFLGVEDPGLTFDVFLHLGTLFATLIYFWRDWAAILVGFADSMKARRFEGQWFFVAVATVPALIAGVLLHKYIETVFRGNAIQATTLVVGGLLLWGSDRLSRADLMIGKMTWKHALGVGVAQCFALVPGISRSGSTMTGGRLVGLDRASAARFSFLISAPITAAAVVFEMRHWRDVFYGPVGMGPAVAAGIASFVFGCLTIGGLLRLLRSFGFASFVIYRIALAGVILYVLGV